MEPSDTDFGFTRRGFLRAGAGATAGLAAVGATGTAAADMDAYNEYLADEDTWGGITIDARGRSGQTVQVAVGAEGNGDFHAFDPAAIVIDPGTTVRWLWTGDGGAHNVVHHPEHDPHDEQAFDSQPTTQEEAGSTAPSDQGVVYEHTFDEDHDGFYTYHCVPHDASPMRGVVVMGEENVETDIESHLTLPEPQIGGWLDDVDNYRGIEDWRGNEEVRVKVGATNDDVPGDLEVTNGMVFEPPAIHVDDGTTVIWEWTGEGGDHNVEDDGGEFESELTGEEGFEFEYTFEEGEDESGNVYNYFCDPHVDIGMLGSVVVGDNYPTDFSEFRWPAVWGGAGVFGVVSVAGVAAYRELVHGEDE